MGSNAQDIKLLNRTQQILPENAIRELKAAVEGEVIVRGEAPEEVYRAALDRWNKAWIQEAASLHLDHRAMKWVIDCSLGSHCILRD